MNTAATATTTATQGATVNRSAAAVTDYATRRFAQDNVADVTVTVEETIGAHDAAIATFSIDTWDTEYDATWKVIGRKVTGRRSTSIMAFDGNICMAPSGATVAAQAKKVRAMIELANQDDADRADLTALVATLGPIVPGQEDANPLLTEAPEVGQVVYVHSMGAWRRGRVAKVARTRTTVAFTTRSSAGRIFRKAVPTDSVRSA